jgi:hypothetical protein
MLVALSQRSTELLRTLTWTSIDSDIDDYGTKRCDRSRGALRKCAYDVLRSQLGYTQPWSCNV